MRSNQAESALANTSRKMAQELAREQDRRNIKASTRAGHGKRSI